MAALRRSEGFFRNHRKKAYEIRYRRECKDPPPTFPVLVIYFRLRRKLARSGKQDPKTYWVWWADVPSNRIRLDRIITEKTKLKR